jgi:hypothetical protein
MMHTSPGKIILIGFALVVFGFLVPLLMMVRVIKPSFLLSFLSHGASVAGLFLGLMGTAWYSGLHKGKRR